MSATKDVDKKATISATKKKVAGGIKKKAPTIVVNEESEAKTKVDIEANFAPVQKEEPSKEPPLPPPIEDKKEEEVHKPV